MSIGPDIKEAIDDVGVSFTVLEPTPISTPEKLVYKGNSQATKPFIREFFLSATLSYDTNVNAGSVIKMTASATPYIVMNKTPTIFEDGVIDYEVVLYKCNVSGELLRISGEVGWNPHYKKTPVFQTIKAEAFALQNEELYGSGILVNEGISAISVDKHDLYVPSSYGVKELDRYQPVSGEYYMVRAVKKRMYENVDVCELVADER